MQFLSGNFYLRETHEFLDMVKIEYGINNETKLVENKYEDIERAKNEKLVMSLDANEGRIGLFLLTGFEK